MTHPEFALYWMRLALAVLISAGVGVVLAWVADRASRERRNR